MPLTAAAATMTDTRIPVQPRCRRSRMRRRPALLLPLLSASAATVECWAHVIPSHVPPGSRSSPAAARQQFLSSSEKEVEGQLNLFHSHSHSHFSSRRRKRPRGSVSAFVSQTSTSTSTTALHAASASGSNGPNVIKPLPAFSTPAANGQSDSDSDGDTSTDKTTPSVEQTTLQRLSSNLEGAVSSLLTSSAASVSDRLMEEWSVLIYDSMSAPSRTFHCLDHLWDITSPNDADPAAIDGDAIQTIAAYFHDVVYYTIDGGLSPAQSAKLSGIIAIDPADATTILLSPDITHNLALDPYPAMVCDVFGFDAASGTELNPFDGLNEFLSAVIAVRCLQSTLSFRDLIATAACIEATVPFRFNDDNGISPSEALYSRLVMVRNKYQSHLSGGAGSDTSGSLTDADLIQMVQRAVGLANRDIQNFAECPHRFLANTWALLPESNTSFRNQSGKCPTYRISDYASALTRMAGFFTYLDPAVIFAQFRGYPASGEYHEMIGRARQNLKIAQTYMKAKVLAAGVLASLAELSGGDCPMTLLCGDIPSSSSSSPRIEDYIEVDFPPDVTIDETAFSILRDGRDGNSTFDIPNSPIATYIYGMIGDKGLTRIAPYAVTPMDATSAKVLLGMMPNRVVNEIALAASNVATSRRRNLKLIAVNYEESEL